MTESLRYVVDEQGKQVAVLLDLGEYERLIGQTTLDPEILVGLNRAELQALAESKLAPAAQTQLSELLAANKTGELLPAESAELDHLLEQVDHLTILKTRARYTLKFQETLTTAA